MSLCAGKQLVFGYEEYNPTAYLKIHNRQSYFWRVDRAHVWDVHLLQNKHRPLLMVPLKYAQRRGEKKAIMC